MAIAGLSVAAATGAIFTAIHQITEIVYGFWSWRIDLPSTPVLLAGIAVTFLGLQFFGSRRADGDYVFHLPQVDWHASENAAAVIATIWALILDLIYSGPRLIAFSCECFRLRRKLRKVDRPVCAAVLQALQRKGRRISLADLELNVSGFTTEEHLGQMLLISGILHLHSEPPGLALSTELKADLADRQSDAYATLRLAPGASKEEVKEAYRQLTTGPPADPDALRTPAEAKRGIEQRRKINQAYGEILDELN
jgi:hypothetical protein